MLSNSVRPARLTKSRYSEAVTPVRVRLLETRVGVEGDGRLLLANLALAGSDEDNAVRRTRTIDGRGGRILQDVDGLDVSRVQVVEVAAGDTVDDDERAGGTGGADTTDRDAVAGTRHTTGLDDVHTRDGAVQGAERVGRALLLDLVTGNVDRRAREETLLLRTVTDNDRLIEEFDVFLEHDIDGRAPVQLLFLGRETDAGERKRGIGRNGDGVVTVRVREAANSIVTVEHDSDTDDRFTIRV